MDTFTENQRKIYKIAKDYLQKNPHFTINELILVCKKNSNLPKNEISKILEKFIRKKIFVPGSRLTSETVLKNKTRLQIYNYLSVNPGLNFNQILNLFKIGPFAGHWHLEMLKKFGFIKERKFAIYKVFFHKDIPADKELIIFLLRNPNVFNIYLCLIKNPCTPNDLSKILDLHYSTIQYHLKKMQHNKLIIANDDKTYSINSGFQDFLTQHYDWTVPRELNKKIEEYIEPKRPVPSPQEEIVKVLREGDYLGGPVHYKVVVQNYTKLTISKIDIMITATSQYTWDHKVKSIDYLVPGETRGVDFILTPLTCGKSQIYATVAYTDGFGHPQTLLVPPKEIQIKCPLVAPKKVLKDQIDDWKQDLLKGSSSIQFKALSPKQIFEIAYNQIKTLNLSEVLLDEENFLCIFSGLIKDTSQKILLEAKVPPNTLTLDVWTNNLKHSTGLLANIRNQIDLAFQGYLG